jgi:thioredoxin:protein disulfide reductase
MLRIILALLMSCVIAVAHAQPDQPLPAKEAFAITGFIDQDKQLVLQWNIASSYYLYRDQVKIKPAADNKVAIGDIELPPGQNRHDELHGDYQSYFSGLIVHIPLLAKTGKLDLDISYQGCSSHGFCYPPVKQHLLVDLNTIVGPTDLTDNIVNMGQAPVQSEQGYVTQLLAGHHIWFILASFLMLGLLLAFTPCVLPMVPILSSIIVGYGKDISTGRAFSLSLAYVMGMAIAYALAGVLVALLGSSVQVALQKTWVIALFSGLFVLLALSLFGFYDLQLPNKLHRRVASWSGKHQGGTYVGVFFMGAFATLVVSPCVSAPLVGALAYIAHSGNVVLGGTALLALGIGMGIPLLLVGTSAGKLLPKSGAWMDKVKQLFGLMMLGLAIWMLARILPVVIIFCLWAALALGSALFIMKIKRSHQFWQFMHHGLGATLILYAIVLVTGAIVGSSNPLHPFEGLHTGAPMSHVEFATVKNMDDLDHLLTQAKNDKKQVILDFYADWCTSCVAMDHHVFNQPAISHALNHFVLLRADVTANNKFDQELLKRYSVVAPPTMIFFDDKGNQLPRSEIVGEVSENEFLGDIERVATCGPASQQC